ncbi:MAG: dihydrofolate reductase [Bacteroidota bacterium]|nr:dihydrofolate reductase [Bacteroidota bacterium]
MLISLIVAASTNNAIGKNNQLLWHLPADLKFFKNTTWAMPVAMGRKTFESLGAKPLPGRMNIIITRQKGWEAEGVLTVHSLEDAVFLAKQYQYKEVFIAGGGDIYQQAFEKAHQLYMTRVHTEIDGDTFFPEIDETTWKLLHNREYASDAKHKYSFSVQLWKKY